MKKVLLLLSLLTVLILTASCTGNKEKTESEEQVGDGILPAGYTQLEYIKSDGTVFFNTNIYPTDETEVSVDFEATAADKTYAVFGCMDSSYAMLIIDSSKVQTNCGKDYYPNFTADFMGKRVTYTINAKDGYGQVGDKVYEYSKEPNIEKQRSVPMYILARTNGDYAARDIACGKLYGAVIKQGGKTVRNYIPAKDKDGYIGLYDTVTELFTTSSETAAEGITYTKTVTDPTNGKTDSYELQLTDICGNSGFCLPADADFSALPLSGIKDGSIIYGSKKDKDGEYVTVEYHDGQPLNITSLFDGDMKSGKIYRVYIKRSENHSDCFALVRTSGQSSMFITLGSGIAGKLTYDSLTLYDINHDDKKLYEVTSGSVIKVSADGSKNIVTELQSFGGRGNTSWAVGDENKKPYSLKTKQAELITGAKRGKSWTLVANNVYEMTGLGNLTAYYAYKAIGGDAALDFESVDLYVDGEYIGLYILMPKINDSSVGIETSTDFDPETSRTARVIAKNGGLKSQASTTPIDWSNQKITARGGTDEVTAEEQALLDYGIQAFSYCKKSENKSDGGYIIEFDFRFTEEDSWFVTRNGIVAVVSSPSECSLEQITVIAKKLQDVEDALNSDTGYNSKGERYSDLVDLDSLAKRFIVDCFTLQADMMSASSYMFIDGDENGLIGKLMTGPAWDYDGCGYDGEFTSCLYKYSTWRMRGCRTWIEIFLSKGDFVSILASLNESFTPLVEEIADGDENTVGSLAYFEKIIEGSLKAEEYNLNKEYDIDDFVRSFKERVTKWKKLWSDDENRLRGVTASVSDDGKTIVSSAVGAESYQWYKISEDLQSVSAVKGADEAAFTPTESGIYFVTVKGDGIGRNQESKYSGARMDSNPVEVTVK